MAQTAAVRPHGTAQRGHNDMGQWQNESTVSDGAPGDATHDQTQELKLSGCALMRYHHLVSQSGAESFIFASKLAVTASETQTKGGGGGDNRQQRYYTVFLTLKGQFT